MSLVAAQDVTIANTNLTGLIPKKISSSLFQIHAGWICSCERL